MFDALGPDGPPPPLSPPIIRTIKTQQHNIMKIMPPIAPYCLVCVSKTFATVGFVTGRLEPSDPVVIGVPAGAGGAPGANEAPGAGGDPPEGGRDPPEGAGGVPFMSCIVHPAFKFPPDI